MRISVLFVMRKLHLPLMRKRLICNKNKLINILIEDDVMMQGALKPESVGVLFPGNLISHRKFEVK